MGMKRNRALAGDGSDESNSASTKRRREQHSSKPKQAEGKPDPTYGQRIAFPGLDDDGAAKMIDDDLEFEEDADALAYLRAVRQEASSVPHVLVAPKAGPQLPAHLQHADDIDRSIYDDGVGDSRGYYHDGAYTAAPSPPPSTAPSIPDDDDDYHDSAGPDRIAAQNAALRTAYFASLTTHFLSLRTLLHRTPPAHRVAALPRDHGTEVGAFGAKSWTFRVWTRRLRQTDPLPVQVAALDRQAALRLLRVLLGGKFVRRGCELRERTSRWIWALLARLPDRGEMDYAEVGWVRELGKRAVLMMVSMAQMEALREEVEGDLEGGVVDDDEEEDEREFVGEMVVDEEEGGGVVAPQESDDMASKPAPSMNTTTAADESAEEGEIDMDIDDGEVSDDEPTATAGNEDIAASIAAAKARLLARLENPDEQQQEENQASSSPDRAATAATTAGAFDEAQAQVNMRTTLNMILTVAGEFYGQRDLLEFRDPFPAV
ncbi:hypothetical protein C8A05DRAFT_18939 [Staphylotrichum tortipilum]|uniref:Uncharacterized protein n=1 Tax=Staphylotrichum tortipilum TaxID=2831512 RepID=A0AAN6MCR5_9PEZI|nr:hypothetical protein C8A05DRAFT_18939 [Staphylotrichum longicolle]